jgi:hypothetical protein
LTEILEKVSQELEEARTALEDVLEEVSRGRGTKRDLEAAQSRVKFWEVRLEGAQRQVAEEAEQERKGRIDALKARVLALDEGAVKKLEGKARKALDAYVAAALAHRTELAEIVQELSGLGELPDDLELDMQPTGYGMVVGSERRAPVDPVAACTVMAYDVLRTHLPRQEIALPVEKYR